MPRLDPEYWRSKKEVSLASTRGFSIIDTLPRLLKEAYPLLREFDFGFFLKRDVPARRIDAWEHMTEEDIPDYKSLSGEMPLRFGIYSDAEGHLRIGAYYIMVMEKDYRKRQIAKRVEYDDKLFYGAVETDGENQTGDGVFEEKEYTERKVGEREKTKRRGRPKKKG